jgi:hypothetical protein
LAWPWGAAGRAIQSAPEDTEPSPPTSSGNFGLGQSQIANRKSKIPGGGKP